MKRSEREEAPVGPGPNSIRIPTLLGSHREQFSPWNHTLGMYASSRLNKDGAKFKPVAKPRGLRETELAAAVIDSRPSDSSMMNSEADPASSNVAARPGTFIVPPDVIPDPSFTVTGSSPVEAHHRPTIYSSSSAFGSKDMLSAGLYDTQDYGYDMDQYISDPHFSDFYPTQSQSTSAPRVSFQGSVPISSPSVTKIVPTRGMSIVPPIRTAIAPLARTVIPIATNRTPTVIAVSPVATDPRSAPPLRVSESVEPVQTAMTSTNQIVQHQIVLGTELQADVDSEYSPVGESASGSKKKFRAKKSMEIVSESRAAKSGKAAKQNHAEGGDPDNEGHELAAVATSATVQQPTRTSSRNRKHTSRHADPAPSNENAGADDDSFSQPDEDDYQEAESSTAPKKRKPRQKSASTAPPAKRVKARKSVPSQGDVDGGVDADENPETPPHGRVRKRRQTALELLPGEQIPLGDDGEPLELDPEVVTMAQLCVDMGVGRPSTRTEESVTKAVEWKQKQRLIRQQARERQKAKVLEAAKAAAGENGDSSIEKRGEDGERARLEGDEDENTQEEGAVALSGVSAATERLQAAENSGEITAQAQSEQAEDADLSSLRTNRFAAQVRLDENGEIIMDDLSLTVDRHEAAREEAGGVEYELVEEAEKDRFINSLTWSKKLTGQRWGNQETDLFYHYVGMWGTDFEMIALLMKGRTRREIRNKYNAEARKNPMRLDAAFATKIPIDLSELSQATGLDFSKPAPEFPSKTPAVSQNGLDENQEVPSENFDHIFNSNIDVDEGGPEEGALATPHPTRADALDEDRTPFSPPPFEELMRGGERQVASIARIPVAVRVPIRTTGAPTVRVG
ncbi:Transcription factor TFIIIB component B [Tulasnella sp. JGI-2019a]|nr:Transcription factor TFIIIB component B [Tulasnella sp. JGI-2019a]